MVDYFIQSSIKRPGRVHRYVMREYGERAFTSRGTIKPEYLDKAEMRARKNHEVSLERAIILAKRLKRFAKEKERYA